MDVTKWTDRDIIENIKDTIKLPIAKIRKNQDIVSKEIQQAYKDENYHALQNLDVMFEIYRIAVDIKEFGDIDIEDYVDDVKAIIKKKYESVKEYTDVTPSYLEREIDPDDITDYLKKHDFEKVKFKKGKRGDWVWEGDDLYFTISENFMYNAPFIRIDFRSSRVKDGLVFFNPEKYSAVNSTYEILNKMLGVKEMRRPHSYTESLKDFTKGEFKNFNIGLDSFEKNLEFWLKSIEDLINVAKDNDLKKETDLLIELYGTVDNSYNEVFEVLGKLVRLM